MNNQNINNRKPMLIKEQQEFKNKHYSEATRYMDNAKDYLKQAKKEGKFYSDAKYVRTACGTAYNGVLIALDAFLTLKGIKLPDGKNKRKSIEIYQHNVSNIDKKLSKNLDCVYKVLHLGGYYDGILKVDVIKSGFEDAQIIINKIKPANGQIKNKTYINNVNN